VRYSEPLIQGTLIKRYKRFLCDVIIDTTGQTVTAHCPNSGSMKGIPLENTPVMLSYQPSPSRKLHYTLEMINNGPIWIGVNTGIPNMLTEEAIMANEIAELAGYSEIRREVKYGKNSRIDLLLGGSEGLCYVEVKNVTLVSEDYAIFPDSVTTRGQKHLVELMNVKNEGHRSVMMFIIQRTDCNRFRPAYEIDPDYATLFTEAMRQGVDAYAYQARVTPEKITIERSIPIDWPRS
jgi:sugar fermentation stimulation protein A